MANPSGKRISKEQYDKLVESFIRNPEAYTRAAAHAGVTPETAKKMWKLGAIRKGWAPIEGLVREHQVAIAAQLEELGRRQAAQEQADQQKAREHAQKARVQEAQLTEAARAQLAPLFAAVTHLTRATQAWVVGVDTTGQPIPGPALELLELELVKLRAWNAYERACIAQVTGSPPVPKPEFARPALTVEQITKHMARMTHLAKQSAEALRLAMENYRLYLGQPTDIIGLTGAGEDLAALPPEEFAARHQSVLQALLGAAEASGRVVTVSATGEEQRQVEGDDGQASTRPALRAVGAARK